MEEFIKKISETLGIEGCSIDASTNFKQLPEWSSLAVVNLIVLFEEQYDKDITTIDVRKCQTIGDLYQLTI